jgi:cell division protein FtsB
VGRSRVPGSHPAPAAGRTRRLRVFPGAAARSRRARYPRGRGEGALRRLWIAPAILAAALAIAALDGESGIPAWLRLRDDLGAARERIEGLRAEAEALEAQAAALRSDPFAIESAIREDLGFARPGETVVRIARPRGPGDTSLRNP